AYEVSALKRLTGRYGTREAELDQLLRADRFVDLYPVVRQSMRISRESYSIKKVEAFYGREHTGDVTDAMSSVVEYEQWLADRDLLGDLVQWHRREARPGWWEFFSRGDLEDEQLVEDRTAVGGLAAPVEIGAEKRSKLYGWAFPPQDAKLSVSKRAFDVDTR